MGNCLSNFEHFCFAEEKTNPVIKVVMQLFFTFRDDRSHLCEGLEAACLMACREILADFENTQTNNILSNAFFLFSCSNSSKTLFQCSLWCTIISILSQLLYNFLHFLSPFFSYSVNNIKQVISNTKCY